MAQLYNHTKGKSIPWYPITWSPPC